MGDARTDRDGGRVTGAAALRSAAALPGWSPRAPGGSPAGLVLAAVVYSPELGERVCACVAVGVSLADLERVAGLPKREQVYRWLVDHPDFAAAYTRARQALADVYAHEIIEIADEKLEPVVEEGRVIEYPDNKRRDSRIRTRQWLMGKLNREKYGEASRVEVREVRALGDLSDAELEALKRDMVRRLRGAAPVTIEQPRQAGVASHSESDEI